VPAYVETFSDKVMGVLVNEYYGDDKAATVALEAWLADPANTPGDDPDATARAVFYARKYWPATPIAARVALALSELHTEAAAGPAKIRDLIGYLRDDVRCHVPMPPPPMNGVCGGCGGTGELHGPGSNGNWLGVDCGCEDWHCDAEDCNSYFTEGGTCIRIRVLADILGVEDEPAEEV